MKVYNYILNHIFVTYIRGWGGLLVARLHYLLPHLSYILVDLASIAAPSANFLMVFQVVSTAGFVKFWCHQVVRVSMYIGTLIKESLGEPGQL